MLTRVFQSGNSIAVRIPKELAIVEASQDVLIERVGNKLVISPVPKRTLAGVADIFAEFSSRFMAAGREFQEEPERDWLQQATAPKGQHSTEGGVQSGAPSAALRGRQLRP